MNFKLAFLILEISVFIASCQSKQSTIDTTLQTRVDSILQNKMSEIGAISGQAIVMEVQTGEIKAMVGNGVSQESGLIRTASFLTALETGKVKLSDTIDVGEGVLAIGNDTLLDHNWHRGGYGKLTLKQAFGVSSNIAAHKMVKQAFENEQDFAEALSKYGFKIEEPSLVYNPIGYGIKTTPLQTLKFYNDIAKDKTNKVKEALYFCVNEGLGKQAASEKASVAGATGTSKISENEYAVEFCGYFPADVPKYSIIVRMNKKGLPVSGGLMAGSVFKDIVDYMTE